MFIKRCVLMFVSLFGTLALGADTASHEAMLSGKLIPYLISADKPVGAVIVCPGGGYSHLAPHEGEVVAKKFNDLGLNAFVLNYTVGVHCYPKPLLELAAAVRYLREKAIDWSIESDKIAVCGFSAGGHLVASLGCFFDDELLKDGDSCRPDAIILCYPVISSGPLGHKRSIATLLGPNPSEELKKKMSLENQVHEDYPPVFMWHTMADKGVPVENSLFFAMALKKHEIPFELLVFPSGGHGMGLAGQDYLASQWFELCGRWLSVNGFN